MSDQKDNGKGFLSEKLGGYQVDPPASVWNDISVRLGGRSRRRLIIISLAVAASVALAVTLGINYFGPDLPQDAGIAGVQDQPIQTTPEPSPKVEAHSALAVQEPALPTQRETLEEKVVRTIESVTSETVPPETKEPFPFDIQTPTISEQPIKAAEVRETSQVVTESLAPETGDEVAETLTLEAGDAVTEDLLLDAVPRKDPRWIIGAALSPLYSFRDAEPQALAATPDHESGTISYAGGIQVGYRTRGRLAIESGIFFNKMGISIGASGIQLFQPEYDFAPLGAEAGRSNVMAVSNTVGNIVSKSGEIYVNNYKLNASYDNTVTDQFNSTVNADQGIRQHLDYLEVPLNLRYTVVDRNLEVQLVGGMSTNLLVNNYVTMETADGTTEVGYLTNIRSVNYSGNAGIGLVYHIMKHFSLSLEPRFRYFLNSVNDATLPTTRPYTFGFYTGLNYLF
jgi:hypothetical protein